MNDLRWILIACGAVLLVAIYMWGRRSDKRNAAEGDAFVATRPEPQVEPAFEPRTYETGDYDDPPAERFAADDVQSDDAPIRAPSRAEPLRWQNVETPRAEAPPRIARGARLEPTLGDSDPQPDYGADSPIDERVPEPDVDPGITAELPVDDASPAPTLSMSSTPQPRRIERRKIIALRLAAGGQRYPGDALRSAMEAESLQHGRYDVFHRLHDDGVSIFSIASMIEPGTFDLEKMAGQQYSGVTMFAQLPGPVPGVHALRDLVACGKRLQEVLGGTLQDERGVPLTAHRVDRLRQEIVDFERTQARDQRMTSQH